MPEVQNQDVSGVGSSGISEGESVLWLFPSSWWLLAALRVPQLEVSELQSLLLCSHGFLLSIFSYSGSCRGTYHLI